MTSAKELVRLHWEEDPCGGKHSMAAVGTRAYFAEVERARYELEPFIPGFAQFEHWRGKRVLEVGVGLGTDFVRFVRAGADATGVDLTHASVELVRQRLVQDGLYAELEVADAEELPFEDSTYDLIYSWGVLHHTPDTRRALGEIRRLIRPGGEARIMLYSRRSWVALGVWIQHELLRGRPFRSFTQAIANHMESPGTKPTLMQSYDRCSETSSPSS